MEKPPIATWDDLFNRIKETGVPLGRILGVPKQTAHNMRKNSFIATAHWNKLVAWAEANGQGDITPELLGRIATDAAE